MIQAQACLQQVRAVGYGENVHPHAAVRAVFRDAGHILGSAIIELWLQTGRGTKKLVFSGDLGQPGRPVLRDPEFIQDADVLLVESTYGNRLHRSLTETDTEIVQAFHRTFFGKAGQYHHPRLRRRAAQILYVLARLVKDGRLPALRVYVDSPMAYAATQITMRHQNLLDDETEALIAWQGRANPHQMRVMFTKDVARSIALNDIREGAVIISASGIFCDAGRIKHHLQYNLPRAESSILITGFRRPEPWGGAWWMGPGW